MGSLVGKTMVGSHRVVVFSQLYSNAYRGLWPVRFALSGGLRSKDEFSRKVASKSPGCSAKNRASGISRGKRAFIAVDRSRPAEMARPQECESSRRDNSCDRESSATMSWASRLSRSWSSRPPRQPHRIDPSQPSPRGRRRPLHVCHARPGGRRSRLLRSGGTSGARIIGRQLLANITFCSCSQHSRLPSPAGPLRQACRCLALLSPPSQSSLLAISILKEC